MFAVHCIMPLRLLPILSLFCGLIHIVGPGEYDNADTLGQGKPGLICSKDKRFKESKNKFPGPGAYTVIMYFLTAM